MQPITPNMPEREYRAHPLPSWSAVSRLLDMSPAEWLHEQSRPRTETGPMAWGTLLHALVLEPDSVAERYAVIGGVEALPLDVGGERGAWYVYDTISGPTGNEATYATKAEASAACRKWAVLDADGHPTDSRHATKAEAEAAMLADVGDRQPVTAACMADAIARADHARALLPDGPMLEVAMQGSIEGAACKGKADALSASTGVVLDVKTLGDVTPRAVARAAYDRKWAAQLWTYGELARQSGHIDPTAYAIIVVQAPSVSLAGGVLDITGYPPRVHSRVVEMSAAMMTDGETRARRAWATLLSCELLGEWPDYEDEVVDLPRWARQDEGAEPATNW